MKKRILCLTLILFLFVIVFSNFTSANTFYVKKTGLDSNPGTEAKPFKTIQKAINSLSANGDQIWIYPGDYNESLSAVSLGKNYITLKGIGSGVRVIAPVDHAALYLKNATGWVIGNIYFKSTRAGSHADFWTGSTKLGYSGTIYLLTSSSTTITNCTITGGGAGKTLSAAIYNAYSGATTIRDNVIDTMAINSIVLAGSANCLVKGNNVSKGACSFLYFNEGSHYTVTEDNYFHDKTYPTEDENIAIFWRSNTGSIFRRNLVVETRPNMVGSGYILISHGGTDITDPNNGTIENNTFIGGGTHSAIATWGGTNFTIRNNIIVGFAHAINNLYPQTGPVGSVQIDYNDYYNITSSLYENNTAFFGIGTHNITSNPSFVASAYPYTLSGSSPCINTGYPIGVDMGWLQYGGVQPSTSTTTVTSTTTTTTILSPTSTTTTVTTTTTTIPVCKCCCCCGVK